MPWYGKNVIDSLRVLEKRRCIFAEKDKQIYYLNLLPCLEYVPKDDQCKTWRWQTTACVARSKTKQLLEMT